MPLKIKKINKMANLPELIEKLTIPEVISLEEMGAHHHYPSFRLRAKGILALNAGHKPIVIASILGTTLQSVHNWARRWRAAGLAGILNGNKGGAPTKLTEAMLDSAAAFAKGTSATLKQIKRHVQEQYPDAPDFSLRLLSAGLQMRGYSYKRTRMSLKKTR